MMNDIQNGSSRFEQHKLLYKITVSAVFLALAVVLKLTITFYLPIMGASGLKIDFSGVFSAFPSILFGPWYGGAVCAAADLLGYVLKPNGAFIPALTVTQFLSGFLIGAAASLVKKFTGRDKTKIAAAICCAVLVFTGAVGVGCRISLGNDGISSGFIASADTLPSRHSVYYGKALSPLSNFVCSLAKYSYDSLTITDTNADKTSDVLVIEANKDVDGTILKFTSVKRSAFEGFTSLEKVYIPDTVTSLPDGLAELIPGAAIYTPAGSYAAVYAAKNSMKCEELDTMEYYSLAVKVRENVVPTYTSNDNFRRNLAGYINFMTVGLESIAVIGIAVIILGLLSEKLVGGYTLFLLMISVPRLIVTTINTEILRRTLAVWNGRTFWILLIPRIGEELVSCLIQAYIIALLYEIYCTRIAKNPVK